MSRRFSSRIYDCEVIHKRTDPVNNFFRYSYFLFCIDIDEIHFLQSFIFGTHWWNVFRFLPSDFIFGSNPNITLKQSIQNYALEKGIVGIERIELLANMRTFGYIFNPAAFYFCYDKNNDILCAILEVTNTYNEKKAYFISENREGQLYGKQVKNFYVSPFVDLDAQFEFKFFAPNKLLQLTIKTLRDERVVVYSALNGSCVQWENFALLKRFFIFPLITLQIIIKIHFRALILYLKKVPYFKKNDRLEIQNGGLS